MLRREFLAGSVALLLSNNLKRTTALSKPCVEDASDHNPELQMERGADYAAFLTKKYPDPSLVAILPFTVTLTGWSHGWFTKWNDERKAKVMLAAQLFQKAWSSQEFKDKVSSVPTLLWHEDTDQPDLHPERITGGELYSKLVSIPQANMTVSIIKDGKRQTAASGLVSTDIEERWIDSVTVYDLVNTLSHEATHYGINGWSWDEGHTGPLRNYVSYGIGGITENIAAGWTRCCDDPTT